MRALELGLAQLPAPVLPLPEQGLRGRPLPEQVRELLRRELLPEQVRVQELLPEQQLPSPVQAQPG